VPGIRLQENHSYKMVSSKKADVIFNLDVHFVKCAAKLVHTKRVPFPVLLQATSVTSLFQSKPAAFMIIEEFQCSSVLEEFHCTRFHNGSFSLMDVCSG